MTYMLKKNILEKDYIILVSGTGVDSSNSAVKLYHKRTCYLDMCYFFNMFSIVCVNNIHYIMCLEIFLKYHKYTKLMSEKQQLLYEPGLLGVVGDFFFINQSPSPSSGV